MKGQSLKRVSNYMEVLTLVHCNIYQKKKDFEPGMFHSMTSLFSKLDLTRKNTEPLSMYFSQFDVSTRCGYSHQLTYSSTCNVTVIFLSFFQF